MLPSCATTQVNSTPHSTSTKDEPEAVEEQVRVGMSKAQVLRIYGEPSGQDSTAHGDVWVWGNSRWLRQIPYAGPFLNVNTKKVMFRGGRVVDFRNTNSGNIMSQMEGQGGSRFSDW